MRIARSRGHVAFTVDQFLSGEHARPAFYDAILLAHVVEHMTAFAATELLSLYLPYLRPNGKVFFICPQESGFASDDTHVTFTTGVDLMRLASDVGLEPNEWRSFPLPRWAGTMFRYNEFNVLATKPG